MKSLTFLVCVATLVITTRDAQAQVCTDKHYRWTAKTDTTLASQSATSVDVSDVLAWKPYSFTQKDKSAARKAPRENHLYSVTAWVRRIRLHETDCDWHVEITEEEDSPVAANCIIVEIPDPKYGTVFKEAREALAALVDTTQLSKSGDVAAPVQVTFTGAALFDGYHQKHLSNGGAKAVQHGRCNSTVSALWELHPIYIVTSPEEP